MISARTLRVLRIVGVVYMLLAIAYLVMPLDLDRVLFSSDTPLLAVPIQ